MTRLLKFILIIVVLVGIAVGGVILYLNMDKGSTETTEETTTEEPAPVIRAPIFSELEPFTVILYGETRNRILYISITLRLENQFAQKQISEYMPEVRDRILKVLSIQKQEQIQTSRGREQLADDIKASLTKPYNEQLAGPKVIDVLFTAFVVQ